MKLTIRQVEEIVATLHESMQFFNLEGQPANGMILERVQEVLIAEFVRQPESAEVEENATR